MKIIYMLKIYHILQQKTKQWKSYPLIYTKDPYLAYVFSLLTKHASVRIKYKHNCEMIAYRQVKQIVLSSTVIYTEIKL